MKIYIVRHGDRERIGDSFALSNEGERQILVLARRLRQNRINASKIYAFSYNCCVKTAEILSKSLYIPYFRDDRLEDISRETFFADLTMDENVNMVREFIDEIVLNGKDVILSMPNGISKAAISYLTGLSLPDMTKFDIDHGSLSLVEVFDNNGKVSWKIKFLNDTTHLSMP